MKQKRSMKKVLLIMAMVLFLSGSSFMVKAEDTGKCVHDGKIIDKSCASEIGRKLVQTYYVGVEHPCYVMGKIATCKTYYDKYNVYYKCDLCDEIMTTFEYSDLHHKYRHGKEKVNLTVHGLMDDVHDLQFFTER